MLVTCCTVYTFTQLYLAYSKEPCKKESLIVNLEIIQKETEGIQSKNC